MEGLLSSENGSEMASSEGAARGPAKAGPAEGEGGGWKGGLRSRRVFQRPKRARILQQALAQEAVLGRRLRLESVRTRHVRKAWRKTRCE